LPRRPTDIIPGDFGGVETPMALADNRLFVPWLDFPAHASATGLAGGFASDFSTARGGFTAVDAATGNVLWQRKLPSADFGGATVANDVVFTSSFDGTVYAFEAKTGKTLWTAKAPAGSIRFRQSPATPCSSAQPLRRSARTALRTCRLLAVGIPERGGCTYDVGSRSHGRRC
jgi:alcohol dehydrogenase (cytochrome c)